LNSFAFWFSCGKYNFSSEEEEREMEQIDRITNALVEEETAEEGEAITRGRMSPEKGLGTASIVGIALGFVGIICMAGESGCSCCS